MRPDLLFVGTGLLLVALGWPLARRRIKPNRWYGVRLPATFADERVWYEANALAGRDMMLLGSALGVAALLLPVLGLGPNLVAVACAALLTVGSLAATLRSWRLANRMHRGRTDAGRR
jgi:uncharacterized membrane protein